MIFWQRHNNFQLEFFQPPLSSFPGVKPFRALAEPTKPLVKIRLFLPGT